MIVFQNDLLKVLDILKIMKKYLKKVKMKNIYFVIPFYHIVYLSLVKAIYIPYGQLECDILKSLYQVDNTNSFSEWNNENEENNDTKSNDEYIDLINKFYKDCFLKQPIKSVRYIKNYEEIFKKGK